jgi:hypothetical protein
VPAQAGPEGGETGVVSSRVDNARFPDRSQKRIFDTNVRQAYSFGRWKQGMKPGGAASRKFVYLSVPLNVRNAVF